MRLPFDKKKPCRYKTGQGKKGAGAPKAPVKRKGGENPPHASRCRDRGRRLQYATQKFGEGAASRMSRQPESLPFMQNLGIFAGT